ncbi:MAG TPA: methyl-accepting chemotaxis protein, partial [Afifellaceae bacterium]|nr:methyl-accepting chemotaxis protein [Afifellaceae bacterium]
NTYNKAYPQVLGGYRIIAYLGDLDNAILALTNTTNIQNIQQIEKGFQADAVELRSWLERTRERAGDRVTELDAISAQFDAYADLVTARDGLFALHRANIGARIQEAGTNAALDQAIRNFENALVNISAAANDINTRVRSETVATIRNAITAIIAVIAVGILAGCGFGYLLSRAISLPLSRMTNVTGRLAAGDMAVAIPGGNRGDEIGDMARSLEQIRSVGVRAAQAQSSLDDASSPMMIVDLSGHVIFPNKAMNRLFDHLSDSLARHLDGFGEQSLAGAEFDTLHNLDAMKSEILTTTDEPVSRRMIAGDLTLDLTASPVFNDSGNRLGTVVEWQDMTGQVAVEREIAGIVDAATEGNFSQRLTETGKSGFFADLAGGMNKLLEVVDTGLDQVVKVVSALAEGDLSRRMQGEHKGAFARLKQDADRMGDQMEEIVGRITEVSSSVQTATDEISSGISDLSSRTEHQASSLEETTASMEELSATVRQNADNAQEANQMATEARKVATTGGDVVQRSVVAMSGIEASSRKITEIVGLIQEIAFQTNLLALNASVEAARAGEAGRGFAVVANEVRALAQRAASASKDIKELIVNSDGQVKEGVQLVGEAGQALQEIVDSVKKVADYVSEIAAASHEQTTGIEQVSGAITGMDEMTQQNASLVEETNGAILSAVGQVSELRRAIGFFKTAQSANIDLGDTEDDEDSAQPEGNALQQPRPIAKPSRSLSAGSGALAQKVDVDWNEF